MLYSVMKPVHAARRAMAGSPDQDRPCMARCHPGWRAAWTCAARRAQHSKPLSQACFARDSLKETSPLSMRPVVTTDEE